jgi:hypothetical protein
MQYKGTDALDASALLMPLMKLIGARDPMWASTLLAIEQRLVADSLVYRYRLDSGAVDGLVGQEGTFNVCSFRYVECLSRSGDVEKARFYFEKMLGYSNHLGLYSEELGPERNISGIFRKRSHTSVSSVGHSRWTDGFRKPGTMRNRWPGMAGGQTRRSVSTPPRHDRDDSPLARGISMATTMRADS